MKKMRNNLDEFATMTIPSVPSNEVKTILQQLFPNDLLI
jgi:hypothetical protein